MSISIGKLTSTLEKLAPIQLQADWDNCGLQVGESKWHVKRALLTLDVTVEVLNYAITNNYDFVLAHHPLIFRKLARIDTASTVGKIINLALTNKIAIYAMHTNLDVIQGGVSDRLAAVLGLTQTTVLDRQKGDYTKLVVFVPKTHLEPVRKALGDAGAGWIGNYSHCTFASPGHGQFLPREGANPWQGSRGTIEDVEEYRLETLVEGFRLPHVLGALKNVHPYEEIAYDLLPMDNTATYGLGRIGALAEPIKFKEFTALVAKGLGCSSLKVSGDDEALINKVALCGGSGGDFVTTAHRRGADVLVTAEIGYHQALEAAQLGLCLIDPGHFQSEFPILDTVKSFLETSLPGLHCSVYPYSTDPFRIKNL